MVVGPAALSLFVKPMKSDNDQLLIFHVILI